MSGREAAIHPARDTEREVREMVKVSVEVHSGAARFRVAIQAESIQRAMNLVVARYPGGNCRVKFPIEPEVFFVEDPTALTGIVGTEYTQKQAA
jgi:hypothetical protein